MYLETDSPINLGSGNGGANSGFFGNDGWWAIILFAMIFGWGNNGWGNNGLGSGAMNNYVLASDFATLQRQIDSGITSLERKGDAINSGLCDGFYAMNTGLLNGFSTVQAQIADCCCKTQSSIKDVNYNIAMQTNAINQALCTGFRDVIDSNNANYRALHDEIIANRIEDKNATITAQQNEINALRLSASQSAQNSYLINTLRPTAIPAYITCSPYQSIYGTGTCGSVM